MGWIVINRLLVSICKLAMFKHDVVPKCARVHSTVATVSRANQNNPPERKRRRRKINKIEVTARRKKQTNERTEWSQNRKKSLLFWALNVCDCWRAQSNWWRKERNSRCACSCRFWTLWLAVWLSGHDYYYYFAFSSVFFRMPRLAKQHWLNKTHAPRYEDEEWPRW